MNRRNLLGALIGILLAPWKTKGAPADEFYVKVLRVDRSAGELEVELSTPPKKTKVVFSGEVGNVFDGDFVKFAVRNKRWTFGGKEMAVKLVTWIF